MSKQTNKKLIMVGAMYENGGNTTQRFLDGHPALAVYPFESQLGTKLCVDTWSSAFPLKYRWPVFSLSASPEQDFESIVDEELRVRIKTPHVSKFRDYPLSLTESDRRLCFYERMKTQSRTRRTIVESFFDATFSAWKDHRSSGSESHWLGYSPILTIDAAAMLADFSDGHFIHVVRNPWSAYADTKKRPVPLALETYVSLWSLNQYFALQNQKKYPDRFHLVRFEDLVQSPRSVLGGILKKIGLTEDAALEQVSWNSQKLDQVYPWGTIKQPTSSQNLSTAKELSMDERERVDAVASPYLELLGYKAWF